MARNDIYNNQGTYERFVEHLKFYSLPPEQRPFKAAQRGRYYVRNPANLVYFEKMIRIFDFKNTSYIRRLRLLRGLLLICDVNDKDLADLDRDEVNDIVAFVNKTYNSPEEKKKFIRDLKYFWKCLFPEKDEKGRVDETKVPYPVRHLSAKTIVDKSEESMREDRLYFDEFCKLVRFFNSDCQTQFYITLAVDSIRRPQETFYRKIKDVRCYENYAKIFITEHGKEGIGLMQCIDSYPYLLKHLEKHPYANDPEAYLFIKKSGGPKDQMKPYLMNKILRKACQKLGIKKSITCYSLKRNGVTYKEMEGNMPFEIQHTAGWTSTEQLKHYDLSSQEDALRTQLARRGLLTEEETEKYDTSPKICAFCNTRNGFTETICRNCKRPLNQDTRKDLAKKEEEYEEAQDVLNWIRNDAEIKKMIDSKIRLMKMNQASTLFKKTQ